MNFGLLFKKDRTRISRVSYATCSFEFAHGLQLGVARPIVNILKLLRDEVRDSAVPLLRTNRSGQRTTVQFSAPGSGVFQFCKEAIVECLHGAGRGRCIALIAGTVDLFWHSGKW